LIKQWSATSGFPEKSKIFQGANNMTITFILLGSVIFLFIIVPLLKMIVTSDPQILLETALDSEVITSIGLTLYAALILAFCWGCP